MRICGDILGEGGLKWNRSFNIRSSGNKVVCVGKGVDNIMKGDGGGLEIRNIRVGGKCMGELYVRGRGGVDGERGLGVLYGENGEGVVYNDG